MKSLQIPDVTAEISPNITFKTAADKEAIVKILAAKYAQVKAFNEAPASQNREKAIAELERIKEKTRPGYSTHYLPTIITKAGKVENMVIVTTEPKGPQRGHWAKKKGKPVLKNGKPLWIEGQHNYKRQRNPYNPEEPILGTKVMNVNLKKDEVIADDFDPDARIVRYGVTVHRRQPGSAFFAKALARALMHLSNANPASDSQTTKLAKSKGEAGNPKPVAGYRGQLK